MNSPQRVFITGCSALTSCGLTAEATWQSIIAGQSGIDEIKQWDIASWSHRLGGEIKPFQPAALLPDKKLLKVISRQDILGINAAAQAIGHSQLLEFRDTLQCAQEFNENTAVYVGSAGNKYYQQYDFLPLIAKSNGNMHDFAQNLFQEVHPMWLLRILPNNVLAYTGINYGFKGCNHNITNHAVGGTQALLEAYHAIKHGQAQRAVVVAYDIGTEPQALFYYERLGLLSHNHLKPFDTEHNGTILAEGAAAIVLESGASASARQAPCYAELLGGLAESEATGLFNIEDEGQALASLLQRSIQQTSVTPKDISLIVAHGNGNPKSDISEAHAINSVFTPTIPVTAFKWATGHTLAASGLLDAVMSVYALRNRTIPGIAPLENLDHAGPAINVHKNNRQLQNQQNIALSISRGFAGINACLLLRSCD